MTDRDIQRDRLIELLEQAKEKANGTLGSMNNGFGAWYADYILADGWIRPPCKVGDRLYQIVEMNHTAHKHHNVFISDFPITVEPYQIVYRNIMGGYSCIPFDDFGKTVFLTKEEAEEKLKELGNNAV